MYFENDSSYAALIVNDWADGRCGFAYAPQGDEKSAVIWKARITLQGLRGLAEELCSMSETGRAFCLRLTLDEPVMFDAPLSRAQGHDDRAELTIDFFEDAEGFMALLRISEGAQSAADVNETYLFDKSVLDNTVKMLQKRCDMIYRRQEAGKGTHAEADVQLRRAVDEGDIAAARRSFELGADPNCLEDDDCHILWDLQYLWDEDAESRYELAKLFFEYGADPDLAEDDETLYDYVMFKVFNEIGESGWEYLCKFVILLAVCGGGRTGGQYGAPLFCKPVDIDEAADCELCFAVQEDNYHMRGYILGLRGDVIAGL